MHEIVFIDPTSNNFSETQKGNKIEENKQTKKTQKPEMVISTMTRRVMPTTIGGVEKHLPNGDIYIGSFVGNSPHGFGKYLWKDGCMHEGEWKRGKANGKGKFSWPSGATYIGDFKGGRMEGIGMFIGVDGDVYKGGWMCDRKHGYGEKRYVNGDVYEGTWKRDLQDGVGKYVWKNGNVYSGEWKRGVICGKGVLVWANGDRFEGCWENGVPRLKGDGWNEDERDFPMKKRSSVDGSRRSLNERSLFPRICIWESDGEAGDITCDIVDNVEVAMLYGDGFRECRKQPFGLSDEVKRPGKMISKGHKNYELMINLQMGIRYSIEKHASVSRDLKPSDFDPNEKFWTRFPPGGSSVTPPHQSAEFRWKDYCPLVFRMLRELFQVDPAQYMLAICGNGALRELSSPGKSGSSFYLTQDDRFLIKTVKKSEIKVLIRMLQSYYQHICRYQNSLLTKFCGVHCVKPVGGPKIRFIVMENLFCSEYRIHRRFDLKGSSHGRITDKPEEEIDETATLKDLDLNFSFRLETHRFQELIKQIDHDCLFLEAQRIMDYSLLVGMHFRDQSTGDKFGLSPFISRSDSYKNERFTRGRRFLEADLQNLDRILSAQKPPIRLGASMPARAERMARRSDFGQYTKGGFGHYGFSRGSEVYEVVLYFGIIDILQDYDITKRLEHAYKSLQADPTSISAVDPKLYSKRFRDFIGRIFIEDR